MMLVNSHFPRYTLLLGVIVAIALVTVACLILIVQLAIRARKRPIVSGNEELIGS
jgi:membrane-bound serine protease (ClpP class)